MEPGFQKADSDNLPKIDSIMMVLFFGRNPDFISAEIRRIKALRSTRESYGDKAVGYVQVKREGDVCLVKGRITPEHRVTVKPYCVVLKCNEVERIVESVTCEDCPASQGGCKHAVAFLTWIHRRSEEPSTTDVKCYWKKSILSSVGTSVKFIKATEMEKSTLPTHHPINNSVFEGIKDYSIKTGKTDTVLTKYFKIFSDSEKLSIHYLLEHFKSDNKLGSATKFQKFCSVLITAEQCWNAFNETIGQSENPLWHELRYSRITASKAYSVLHCKKVDGIVVESILGACKIKDTETMKRGRVLENKVLLLLSKIFKKKLKPCGLMLNNNHPFVGASADAICEDFTVEIKCPVNETNFRKYITQSNEPAARYIPQLQLQMHFLNKNTAKFCVAHPDFETSQEVSIVTVDYSKEYCDDILLKLEDFWKQVIFEILMKWCMLGGSTVFPLR